MCRQYVIVRRFCLDPRGVSFSSNLLIVRAHSLALESQQRASERASWRSEKSGETESEREREQRRDKTDREQTGFEINSVSCIPVWFSDGFSRLTTDYRPPVRSPFAPSDTPTTVKQGRSRFPSTVIVPRFTATSIISICPSAYHPAALLPTTIFSNTGTAFPAVPPSSHYLLVFHGKLISCLRPKCVKIEQIFFIKCIVHMYARWLVSVAKCWHFCLHDK